jgi:alginate O-acetyltransferase complex protein AlgI
LSRKESLPLFSSGVERFIIGLVKKVIIANQFAIISHEAFSIPIDVLPQSLAGG